MNFRKNPEKILVAHTLKGRWQRIVWPMGTLSRGGIVMAMGSNFLELFTTGFPALFTSFENASKTRKWPNVKQKPKNTKFEGTFPVLNQKSQRIT